MTLQDKVELLRNTFLFGELQDEDLQHIASILQEVHYDTHHLIIEEGTIGQTAYILCSGSAKVYTLTEDGKEIPLSLIHKGEVFGEMALLDGEPRSATVEALTPIHALIMSKEHLFPLLDTHSKITHNLLARLSRKIRALDSCIESLYEHNTSARTYKVLFSLTKAFKTAHIPLTHEELALLTGITRPRLTEALHTLEAEGKVILSHKNIHVL